MKVSFKLSVYDATRVHKSLWLTFAKWPPDITSLVGLNSNPKFNPSKSLYPKSNDTAVKWKWTLRVKMERCASFYNMDIYHWTSIHDIDHHFFLWRTITECLITVFLFCRSLVRGWNDAGSYWCVIRAWNVSETTLDSRLLVVLLWSDAGNAVGQLRKKIRGDSYLWLRPAILDLVPRVFFVRLEEIPRVRG